MQHHRHARAGATPSSAAKCCGALLRQYREEARLTREALATKVRYSPEAIKKYEYGERIPPPDAVNVLADALALGAEQGAALHAAARLAREAIPDEARLPRVVWPPLVGRTAELAVLGRHMLGEGAPVLLFAGEPGIGKTRLLDEAERLANEQGWRVLRGGCTRRSGQEPYEPFVSLLSRFREGRFPAEQSTDLVGCSWLACLLPELAESHVVPTPSWTLPPEQERRLMFAAVGRFLTNVAGPLGALLLLDDMQWAGVDALDLLATLARTQSERPLRVIGAYRDTEGHAGTALADMLADLARDGLVEQRTLTPLASEEARAMLARLVDLSGNAWNEELTEQVVQRTGGVPFFLVSCAQSLRAGAWDGRSAAGFPWTVKASVGQRMAALSMSAQEALRIGAVMDRILPTALLTAVAARSGRDEETLVAALEEACQAHLLREAGDEAYAFAHDLIREAIETDLRSARRRLLHRRIAEALEQLPERARERRAAELTDHFEQAGERTRAIPYALQAGGQAEAVYAHAEAEKHYRTAAELARETGDRAREAEALERAGIPVVVLGRGEEARSLLERALELYGALGDREGKLRTVARLLDLWGPAALERGRVFADSLEAEGSPGATRGQAAFYSGLGHQYFVFSRFQDALSACARAVQIARALKDDALLAEALQLHAMAAESLGEDVLPALHDLVPLAERVGNLTVLRMALAVTGFVYLYHLADFARAKSYLERALEVAERRGGPYVVLQSLGSLAEYHYFAGEWGPARAHAERAAAMMRQIDRPTLFDIVYQLGMLDLAEGREQDAEQHLGQGLALAESWDNDATGQRWGQRLLAERDLVAGNPGAAHARLAPLLDRPGMQESDVEPLLPLLAWAELELGRDEQAAATLAAGRARCGRLWLVDALRVEALLEMKRARWQEAVDALDESLTLCRAIPYPYAEAKALYVYGRLHAAKGEPGRAREQYEAALAICEGLGEGLYRPQIERALAER